MNLRERKSVIWRMIAVVFAAVVLFAAPVSHVAPHFCPTEQSASDSHGRHGHDHPRTTSSLDDKACCSATCAACLAVVSDASQPVLSLTPLGPVADMPTDLAGTDPSPGLEPPRSFA